MITIQELRMDFERTTNRSMSMPLAGAFFWLTVAIASLFLPFRQALIFMVIGTGMIFPLALLIAKYRNENLITSSNPLAKLMGMCVLMVNLLWLVHIPLMIKAPEFLPLSLGIGLGLHWIVYSWIIQHPVGTLHAILRTVIVFAVWNIFPDHRITAVALAVVVAYVIALFQMQSRTIVEA